MLDVSLVANIARNRNAPDLTSGYLYCRAVDIRTCNLPALVCKVARDGGTDTVGCTGDDGRASTKVIRHQVERAEIPADGEPRPMIG
jgi:hypothetical protein